MRMFLIYLKLQLKRMVKTFPAIFFVTLLLGAGFGLLVWMQFRMDQEDTGKQKIALGVVGDTEDSYLGFGIYALENMDSSRYTLTFVRLEETEAARQLENGKISGYIRIPDGFVDSIVSGENKPVTYIGGGSQGGIGSQLIRELADTVSTLITESQTGIYSMQEFYLEQNALEAIYEDTNRLNLRYFDVLLGREKMYRVEEAAGGDACSTAGSYLCAAVVVFLMVWGMNGGILLVKNDMALGKILSAGGMNVWMQAGGEFAAYLCTMAANFLGLAAAIIAAAGYFRLTVPEAGSVREFIRFTAGIWPVLLCIAAMQFLLYSLVSGLTGGLLLNFVGAVALGYLSGCFYPITFFPAGIQKASAWLPTGIGMKYMENHLRQVSGEGLSVKLVVYAVIFFAMAVLVNRKKLKR